MKTGKRRKRRTRKRRKRKSKASPSGLAGPSDLQCCFRMLGCIRTENVCWKGSDV